MRESTFAFQSERDITIAGALCLPEDASNSRPVPAIVLLSGAAGSTRDGDASADRGPNSENATKRALQRRLAHALAESGIATARFDKRGYGESGGRADDSDYETDLVDSGAAVRYLLSLRDIDSRRVGVCGHSAGALNACLLARDVPEIACAGLLGALFGTVETLITRNWGRVASHWARLTDSQREWMRINRPRDVVGAFRVEEFIAAARRGDRTVRLEAEGVSAELELVRMRQDMERPVAAEFRHVRCPALVLHGGDDMNVPVEDALSAYQALRQAGNEHVDLVVVPGVDHSFQPVERDMEVRLWDRLTLATLSRPVSPLAIRVVTSWAARVLEATVPPAARARRSVSRRARPLGPASRSPLVQQRRSAGIH